MNYNKTILAGNLTRDPEVKFTPNGKAICSFGIAVNRKWKGADEQEKEEVFFGDCQSFGKTAEVIGQYFKKGNPIFVEGRLKTDQWDDKATGAKRSATRIIVDAFQFVEGKKGDPHAAIKNAVKSVGKDKPAAKPSDDDDSPPF